MCKKVMTIQAMRKAADLSESDMAQKMGVTRKTICERDSKLYLPKTRQLPELADALERSIDEPFVGR